MPESATLVRTLLAQGRSVRYLVPEAVWQYVVAQRLYGFSNE
jgi:nicotinic acid mononucleotide adenylyltransferase